jgi:hypothetical protein
MLRRRIASQLVAASALAPLAAEAQAAGPLTPIAFGSCMHQEKPQPIGMRSSPYRTKLFLFMGDNVYGATCNGRGSPSSSSFRRSRCWPKATARSAGATSRSSAGGCSAPSAPPRLTVVVFLSGDRHIGALYRQTPAGLYPSPRRHRAG